MDAISEVVQTKSEIVDRALTTSREIFDLTGPEEGGVMGAIRSKVLTLVVDLLLLKKGAPE